MDAGSCLRCLRFSGKKEFSRGEEVLYRFEIRSKTANVAKFNEEKVEGSDNTLGQHQMSSDQYSI